MPGVDTTCVTHSYACDCREAKFNALEAENTALKARVENLRTLLQYILDETLGGNILDAMDYANIAREALEADKPSPLPSGPSP